MVYVLVCVLAGVCVAEGLSAALCWLLCSQSSVGRFIWHPDPEAMRDSWLAHHDVDQQIGGAAISSPASGAPRDGTGAKYNAEFPASTDSCGAAYGESLVLGYEVPLADGWVEQVSHLLVCRIANYAVNYNSPDQSYRRYQLAKDHPPFVILGIDPSTIMDVVSQYTGLIRHPLGPYALKGRYLLTPNGQLEWQQRVQLDADQFAAMHRDPGGVLTHEYFLPDTEDGPVTFRFPYILTLARVALLPRFRQLLSGRAEWSGFYAADHPSRALPLLEAICRAFASDAVARGQRSLIVILPLARSFRMHQDFGQFEYLPLLTYLRQHSISVIDLGETMLAELKGRSFCLLFVDSHNCQGHYSVLGNTIAAHAVGAELRKNEFVR